ncbi:MAG: ABC transporter permease [Spirochaetia bacterium]
MREVRLIAVREIQDLFKDRRSLVSILLFAGVWGFVALPRLFGTAGFTGGIRENLLFYLMTLLSAYSSFILSTTAFVGEKKDGRIRTLLCSPVSLRQYAAGKCVGVAVQAYGIGIVVSGLIALVTGLLSPGSSFTLSLPFLLYAFPVLPLLVLGFTGLIGIYQLSTGLKPTRIFNIIVVLLLFGGLGAANAVLGPEELVGWTGLGLIAAVSLGLISLSLFLSRLIRKEKIVTSVD